MIDRRTALARAGTLVLLLGARDLAWGASIVAVRVWPADEYTRVTIESDTALTEKHFLVADPARPVRGEQGRGGDGRRIRHRVQGAADGGGHHGLVEGRPSGAHGRTSSLIRARPRWISDLTVPSRQSSSRAISATGRSW